MKNKGLFQLFVEELEDMLSAEHQIIDSLPKLIKLASSKDLKEAMTKHLKETKEQVQRIEEIFTILNITPQEVVCEAMKGLIKEAEELTKSKSPSAVTDAAIICAAQKIEHYEIATYGTLHCFADCLDLDGNVSDLLETSLDEEGAADKKLTKIAKGSLFTTGINEEAVEATATNKKW